MRRAWSLQRRLVAALVALLALVSIVVGAASVLALRENLMQRLDQQVGAELRFVEGVITGQGGPGAPGDPVGARASVRLVSVNDAVALAEYVDADRKAATLTEG